MLTPVKLLLNAKRKNKRIFSITYDIFALILSLYLAMAFRLGFAYYDINIEEIASLLITVSVTIFAFIKLGMYRAVLRYMMLPAIANIFIAIICSAITLALTSFFFGSFIPRSVPMIYAGVAMFTLGGPRILIRTIYYYYYKQQKSNVIIYGAGSTGRELAYSLISGTKYHPVAILDDDISKVGQIICGLRVYHSNEFEHLQTLYQPIKLLIAINNIGRGQRLRLVEKVSHWPIETQSVPSVEDIASGMVDSTEIKDLTISDLLGRIPVKPDLDLLHKHIKNRHVLVTGAGGSIGSELCRQIIKQAPKLIVLFELNEYNLYKIDQELRTLKQHLNLDIKIVAALGSVQHKNRMTKVMQDNRISTVYHAAAYKHVPLVEDNIIEGIRNNVFGTLAVAEAAITAGVCNFTLVSTDKAVRPTNVMGASKRMAELVLQALADKQENTVFSMVRFGNVLGSSGSVVPLFKKQIKQGGPVTVTHPDIIRYFMLIPEAAQLVIQAGAMSKNGQVFVLDMGDPVKIVDLAKRMIHLMGMKYYVTNPLEESVENRDSDIEIKFSGLRPGEKLYEELLIGNNVEGTCHKKIMTAVESKLNWHEMETLLNRLDVCCHNFDAQCIKAILTEAPTGYAPTN